MDNNIQIQPTILNRAKKNEYKKYSGLLLFVVILLFSIVYVAYNWSSNRKITTIQIQGNNIIPANDIKMLISNQVINKYKKEIDLDNIAKKIFDNRFVKKAVVSFEGADALKIEVTERIPVAILCNNHGDLKYTDSEGYILPYKYYSNIVDLMLIRNIYTSDSINKKNLDLILEFVAALSKPEFEYINKSISEVLYNQNDKTLNISINPDALIVKFGGINNITEKLGKAQKFLYSYSNSNNEKYEYIDVRWSDQVVVKVI